VPGVFPALLKISLPFLVATGVGRALTLGVGAVLPVVSGPYLGWIPETAGQTLAMKAWLPRWWLWPLARLLGTLIYAGLDFFVPPDMGASLKWLLVWPLLSAAASIPETAVLAQVDPRAMLWPVVRLLGRLLDSGVRMALVGVLPGGMAGALATVVLGFVAGMTWCALCLGFVAAPALKLKRHRA